MNAFNERFRRIRRNADLTQQQLADILGISSSAVAKYENLENSYPCISTLIKIADYFHLSTDYILRGVEPAKNNISGTLTNSTVMQTNRGNATLHGEKPVSPEATELLRIYDGLSVRERLKLLNFAVNLDERSKKNGRGEKTV